MDLGTVMSVVQTLFAALQCKELQEMWSFLGYKPQLKELQRTVGVIQAVLRDAESKEELSHQAQLWVQELKDAVYDADDLLDEFLTLARQKQLNKGQNNASKKVRLFFSRSNPLGVAYKMSQGVKKIRKNLEAIAKNHGDFGFKVDSQPIRRRKETCSYVYENNIIGREDDVEKILDHMLKDSSDVKQDVSTLAIVGIGGLGKTALAQLLYNDPRVSSAFPLKLWTCVSDCDQQELDVQQVLRKILVAATPDKNHEGSSKDNLQNQVRERLTRNRYLLVLDDVWTESRIQWKELEDFLMGGQRGSWLVVTTRSHETTRIVGSGLTHQLQGLSEENSWSLFKSIAFGSEESNPPDDLVKIGEEIVERCAGVPLAIKVAGSVLYGKEDNVEWLSFKEKGLSKHRESQKDILSILEFSYHQLESPLKSCFAYCALFAKDVVIRKDLLTSLWLANDFVIPFNDGQKVEDAAEEYYSILVRRCFFQDVKFDSYGGIVSCKIHDLMHDVSQKVAGREINQVCKLNLVNDDVLKKSRHLSYLDDHCLPSTFIVGNTHVRSYLPGDPQLKGSGAIMDQACLEAILATFMCLRVLHLEWCGIEKLAESIGELLHLRYLDLSRNFDLKVLPKSISKLYNLQTLKLYNCSGLKELPTNLRKLVNLRTLDVSYCYGLSNMPEGMSELSCLEVLPMFVIDGSHLSPKQWCNQLGDLRKLDSLKGELEVRIKVGENYTDVTEGGGREGAYLSGKKHLNHLTIHFEESGGYEEGTVRLLEELQPHPNLKSLELYGYKDPKMRMPGWANNLATSLPSLTYLSIKDSNVEYIDEDSSNETGTSMPQTLPIMAQGLVSFRCLEKLQLHRLPKLKGWGNSRVRVADIKQLSLPQLKFLRIRDCPELICSLLCPNVKELHLWTFNRKLELVTISNTKDEDIKEASSSSSSSSSSPYDISKLREIRIDDVAWLNSFPRKAFQCLSKLRIRDNKLESLREAEEVLCACSSSLQTLIIEYCPYLKRVWPGELKHLITLQVFNITYCGNVRLVGEEEREDGISMSSLPLRELTLSNHQQLADLENWIDLLVNLQSLTIVDCHGLESLPNWLPKLTSLTTLHLGWGCSENLKERCQHTTGQDWPYFHHIPTIKFGQFGY